MLVARSVFLYNQNTSNGCCNWFFMFLLRCMLYASCAKSYIHFIWWRSLGTLIVWYLNAMGLLRMIKSMVENTNDTELGPFNFIFIGISFGKFDFAFIANLAIFGFIFLTMKPSAGRLFTEEITIQNLYESHSMGHRSIWACCWLLSSGPHARNDVTRLGQKIAFRPARTTRAH